MPTEDEIKTQFDRWTEDHHKIAQGEGWDLFDYDCRGLLQIQREDEKEVFSSDNEAMEFIINKADEGHDHAKLALELDAFFNRLIYPDAEIKNDDASVPSL